MSRAASTPAPAAAAKLADTGPLPLRIVKVGGSLLDWQPLPGRLVEWLDSQPAACSVLIAGGGDFTDAVRKAQAIHQFDEATAHWMCVRTLSATAILLARLLSGVTVVRSLDEIQTLAWSGTQRIVMDPAEFLEHDEPQAPGQVLPHDWTATTDSIAARVAVLLAAAELVLLKSADPPPHGSLSDLSAAGYVDQHFPEAARGLAAVRLLNLRAESRE
jgi:aspartokinase-like uncharacterized kinase